MTWAIAQRWVAPFAHIGYAAVNLPAFLRYRNFSSIPSLRYFRNGPRGICQRSVAREADYISRKAQSRRPSTSLRSEKLFLKKDIVNHMWAKFDISNLFRGMGRYVDLNGHVLHGSKHPVPEYMRRRTPNEGGSASPKYVSRGRDVLGRCHTEVSPPR